MILSIVSCTATDQPNISEQEETPPTSEQPVQTKQDEEVVEDEVVGKILLFTLTEDGLYKYSHVYAYARNVVAHYPARIIHVNVPLEYGLEDSELDVWLDNAHKVIEAEISYEETKVVLFADSSALSQAVEAKSLLAERVNKLRPDILIVDLFSSRLLAKEYEKHLVLSYDSDLLAKKSLEKGEEMGVETVFFYISRGTSEAEIYNKGFLDLIREEAKKYDFRYIERDSYSAVGPGYYWKEDVKIMGRNTMFFSNDRGTRVHLDSLWSGAITIAFYPPDLPLIFIHNGPVVFGDYDSLQENVREFLDEHGFTGNLAVWLISFDHIAMMAAVEYAIGYIKGEIETGSDIDALNECFRRGFELLGYPEIGFELHRSETYDNLFFLVQDYMVF